MKRCDIAFAPKAKKQIDILPSNIKPRIADVILTDIAQNPLTGKALKAELKGLYSYRVGDYRVIYSLIKERSLIQIIKVMHRREVYR